mgnify:CR=1 FL=1
MFDPSPQVVEAPSLVPVPAPESAVVATLKRARALIATPEQWCQGQSFKVVVAPDVTAFCALGALNCVTVHGSDMRVAVEALQITLGHPDIAGFNDTHTHAAVLALFDRAIAQAGAGAGAT